MSAPDYPRLDRRESIKWLVVGGGLLALHDSRLFGREAMVAVGATGYGRDPDLLRDYRPGELWPLTLTDAQRRTTSALCDVIIPADNHSRSASAVGVPDFIDEWISAPYDWLGSPSRSHQEDKALLLDGLAWLEAESRQRFGRDFAALTPEECRTLCDDVCHEATARAELKTAARFFKRFRDLTAGGFYTTPDGMKDVGYVGNLPAASFEGPPIEVLEKLGLIDRPA